MYKLVKDKHIKLSLVWMKAHLFEDDDLPNSMRVQDVRGNKMADYYANKAADHAEVNPGIVKPIKRISSSFV